MPTQADTPSRYVITALLLGGFGALVVGWNSWPWATIGGIVALSGLLLMMFRDTIQKYGDSYESATEAASGWKPAARKLHPYIFSIGLPLVLWSAIFQVIGNPADQLVLRAREIPQGTVYLPIAGRLSLDLRKLDSSLNILALNQQNVDSLLGTLSTDELIIVNCGRGAGCECPTGYQRVPSQGPWDLNAGTTGHRITLCRRTRRLFP